MSPKKAILLVEDEAILALSSKRQLEAYGYAVTLASSGEQALEAVKTMPGIDLILMDINLGAGIDGTQAAEIILKGRDIPIVFVSSHSERDVVEKTEKITSYGYVVKNSSITVLDASIKMAFKLFDLRNTIQQKMEIVKATDDRFQLAMNELDGTLWTLDLNLRFTLSRGRGLVSIGLQPDQVIGMKLEDFLQTGDPRNVSLLAHRKALLGEDVNFEYTHNGLTFRTAVSPLRDSGGTIIGVAGIGTDISQRKKAEDALLNSEEKFSKVFHGSPYPIMIIDTDNGCFADVNEAMTRNVEYTREEMLGKTAAELGILTPETEAQARKIMAKSGKFFDLEISIRTKSGALRFGMATGQVITVNNHAYLIQTVIDITDRKHAEDASRDSELNYFDLFNTVKQAIYYQNPDLTFLNVNQGAADMYGYEKEFFIGKTPEFLSAPNRNDMKQVAEYIRLAFEGHPQKFEFWGIKKDGTVFPKDVWTTRGKYFGRDVVITMSTDISERKQKEEALKASEERLLFALEGSGLGEWDWNLKTSRIKRNERWAEMLGYTLAEIDDNLQQGVELQHPDDREESWKAIQDHLAGFTDSYNILYRMRAKDGKYKWIHDCGKIMERDERGNPLRLCGTHADVTDQKEKEEKIKTLLIEKEIILKEVHHRIKNNMSTICSLLSLQAHSFKEASVKGALEDAKSRVQSMSILYDKLYRTSDFTNVSIKDYLPPLIDEIIHNFPNSGRVKVEKHIEPFLMDAKRLQPVGIIVNELLTNIMKYAFIGREGGLITISATTSDCNIAIKVQDDGNGIPESVSFENAFGFGLQLVHALTQQLEGTIRIERGSGTKVVLEIKM